MTLSFFVYIFMSLVALPSGSLASDHSLTIIYSGSQRGELEPCGCSPKTDFGGLARSSGYISSIKDTISPYILLDAGNFAADNTKQGRIKTETLLKSFRTMGYDAVALMSREHSLGTDFISQLIIDNGINSISSRGEKKTALIRKGKLNINISTAHDAYLDKALNILITELDMSSMKNIKGWDIVITSSGEKTEGALKKGSAIIVAGYPRGEKLGLLTINVNEKNQIIDYSHRWKHLGNNIKEDSNIREILNEYDKKVARMLEESAPPPGTTYLGAAKCSECHQPHKKQWEETLHAHAFKTLEEVGKGSDPECLICHTVGFGEKGGFYSIKTTPGLADVQCEVCHGYDRDHIENFNPMKKINEQTCLKCHTKDRSPDFDYPVYMEKVKH